MNLNCFRIAVSRRQKLHCEFGADSLPLEHEEVLVQLERDWLDLDTVHVYSTLALAARALRTKHRLREFDSVQLANVLYAQAPATGDFAAASYDSALARHVGWGIGYELDLPVQIQTKGAGTG